MEISFKNLILIDHYIDEILNHESINWIFDYYLLGKDIVKLHLEDDEVHSQAELVDKYKSLNIVENIDTNTNISLIESVQDNLVQDDLVQDDLVQDNLVQDDFECYINNQIDDIISAYPNKKKG